MDYRFDPRPKAKRPKLGGHKARRIPELLYGHTSRMLLGILVHGHATGVFSCRKLERATYDSAAYCIIEPNDHSDNDAAATFRRPFPAEIEGPFVQVLALAREMGMLKLGKIEERLKAEVADRMAKAETADEAKTTTTGKTPGATPQQPLAEGPLAGDQINFTDEDSRIVRRDQLRLRTIL